ncbi:MAG TPA: hypothetical protein VEJ20_04205, partial [Candidatus Eremiobacteraceae bacterium]|nr:hypothetical protein [Candidatus Eremiobacteraceae bacterium]
GVEGTAGGTAVAGVFGSGASGVDGVDGTSYSGIGVYGSSSDEAPGMLGETFNPSATNDDSEAGVFGSDASTDSGTHNIGVEGFSTHGTGVEGYSTDNSGVYGFSDNSTGVYGLALSSDNFGVVGFEASSEALSTGGVYGYDQDGTGVWGEGTYALVGYCVGSDLDGLSVLTSGTVEYFIDCTGATGTVVQGRQGGYAVATTPESTQRVIEDYGEARLTDGAASVPLDAAFAATISDRTPYLVFVTPDGNTTGLYVAGKTTTGFTVREVNGGHSSLTFDYRIVAKPAFDRHPRMTLSASPPRALPEPAIRASEIRPSVAMTIAQARAASARIEQASHHRQPKRLPLYEPRMGADGKLHPGVPYDPHAGG